MPEIPTLGSFGRFQTTMFDTPGRKMSVATAKTHTVRVDMSLSAVKSVMQGVFFWGVVAPLDTLGVFGRCVAGRGAVRGVENARLTPIQATTGGHFCGLTPR